MFTFFFCENVLVVSEVESLKHTFTDSVVIS